MRARAVATFDVFLAGGEEVTFFAAAGASEGVWTVEFGMIEFVAF